MSNFTAEPEIDLYRTCFQNNGDLERRYEGTKLSDLLEGIDSPLVVALDGGWGSGKSVFLKYWVGQHITDFRDTTCVYFDAFANDFSGDPLGRVNTIVLA
ncbi:MAG: P-loop NTPase fold protein [Pseudomonadota bacterium]